MKRVIFVALVGMLLASCMKPHEAWTGHKEHKPHAGRHNGEAYFKK